MSKRKSRDWYEAASRSISIIKRGRAEGESISVVVAHPPNARNFIYEGSLIFGWRSDNRPQQKGRTQPICRFLAAASTYRARANP